MVPNSPPPAETRFLEVVFPEHSNHYGTLFGGTALSLLGKAAFVAASRRARGAVVMASSEKVEFYKPIQVGQVVELFAEVIRVGKSSMTVNVEAVVENLRSGQRSLALRGRFEMVCVDEHGAPKAIRSDNLCQEREIQP